MVYATKWTIVDCAQVWELPYLYICVKTDVPCHLWLRWTEVNPRMHLHTAVERGLRVLTDPKYCFVQFETIEQWEDGDTLNHNFTFPGWYDCLTRWWYYWGTIGGIESRSNTAIFELHCPAVPWFMGWKHPQCLRKELFGVIDHADRSITADKLAKNIDASDIGFNAENANYWGPVWARSVSFASGGGFEWLNNILRLDLATAYYIWPRVYPYPGGQPAEPWFHFGHATTATALLSIWIPNRGRTVGSLSCYRDLFL